jgi:hypothetical protein
MAKLIITAADGSKTERQLSGTVVIGRATDCDIPLPKDPKASRNHCRIEARGGEFFLSDLGSANNTRLNDEKIGQQVVRLEDGDVIRVGGTRINFQGAGAAAAASGGGAGAGVGELLGKVKGALDKVFAKGKGKGGAKDGAKDGAAAGGKTITCTCGAVLSIAAKSPGQKVGCPRCKKIYQVPGK